LTIGGIKDFNRKKLQYPKPIPNGLPGPFVSFFNFKYLLLFTICLGKIYNFFLQL